MALDDAYKTSGTVWAQVSQKFQPGLVEKIAGIEPGEVVVIRGTYDHVEKLLDTLKISYDAIDSSALGDLDHGRVLFANCKRYSGVDPQAKANIGNIVESGGRLISTDYALDLVQHVFPGRLTKTASTKDDVVGIDFVADVAFRWQGMTYAECSPQWWLEGSSDVFSVGEGVTTLIESEEMEAKYGQKHVAVAFPYGSGDVVHFISHLELQRTKLKAKHHDEGLETFLKKMDAIKTADMVDVPVAELEAAYSTLNTVAHLCTRTPIFPGEGKSTMASKIGYSGPKSVSLV